MIIGDKVAMSVQFLRSTGQEHTPIAHARGVITAIRPLGSNQLVTVDWKDDEIPSKVIAANLAKVGPNSRFCQC